jgi:glutamate-1-semialdehyde 2,1-aminomutase
MSAFLDRLETPAVRATYEDIDARWDGRARRMNDALQAAGLPVRVAAMTSVWTVTYTQPSRYHWMLQFYLRAAGLALSWVGTGRLIFSHNISEAEFDEVVRRFVEAGRAMAADGWWWTHPALTDRAIRRTILREVLRARLGW